LWCSLPAVQHEVGGDDELGAGDILDAEVGDEAGGGCEGPDEEAEGPLERHVAQDVAPSPRPPVLLEHVVLDQPARGAHRAAAHACGVGQPSQASRSERAIGEGGRAGLLVVEALDGADVGADERDLGGGVGVRVAAVEEPAAAAALLLVAAAAVLERRVQEER
jgi:hypothetical protein